ncbi:hypothetical protein Sango_0984900 [Sesamum angolense]|uniref:Uncharacterized protein n=1 Tax=Sesamum angolense TaxID=2727404 RepID=A0AAE1WZD8_9LAMI|nr:hypothetical protein Sango_0984900 [Sesamum angolense]
MDPGSGARRLPVVPAPKRAPGVSCTLRANNRRLLPYGQGHPMKPNRIPMAPQCSIVHYALHRRHGKSAALPRRPPKKISAVFHSPEYVEFLSLRLPRHAFTTQQTHARSPQALQCWRGPGPVFDGLFSFCPQPPPAGSSIGAASQLNRQDADICD